MRRFHPAHALSPLLLIAATAYLGCSSKGGGPPAVAPADAGGQSDGWAPTLSDGGGGDATISRDGAVGDADVGDAAPRVSDATSAKGATLQVSLSIPSGAKSARTPSADVTGVGGANASELESLEYYLYSIMICETLDVSGTAFSNPKGCITLYQGDTSQLTYNPGGDLTALAAEARSIDGGFIDLMSAASRAQLTNNTALTQQNAHSYSWGVITWAPPVKVRASIPLADSGTSLYTHDGVTTSQLLGGGYRDYYTVPAQSMLTGPSDLAVTVLGNGGNWFKFQSPLVISNDDIVNGTTWVLDLVFNPDGLVLGVNGNLGAPNLGVREVDDAGSTLRGISVPMLDLTPVPHRESETALREAYTAPIVVDGNPFELRLELYSLDGDPTRTVYGVGTAALSTSSSVAPPPSFSKISFVTTDDLGALEFESWANTPIVTGFVRGHVPGDTTNAGIVCATYSSPGAQAGGSAIVANACPASIPVTFTLESVTAVSGGTPVAVGGGPVDGGSEAGTDGAVISDAGAADAIFSDGSVGDGSGPTDGGGQG